jgi:hypothetical protein
LSRFNRDKISDFFANTSKPKNAKKKAILKELFKVAKMEERYKRKEIGRLLALEPERSLGC